MPVDGNDRIVLAVAIISMLPVESFCILTAGVSHSDLAGGRAVSRGIHEIDNLFRGCMSGKVSNRFAGHDEGVGNASLPEGYMVAEDNIDHIETDADCGNRQY